MNFHATRNNLPSNTKTTICSLLNARVADPRECADSVCLAFERCTI